jgi:hypothetical protein
MKLQVNGGKLLAIAAALAAATAALVSIWLDPPAENRAHTIDLRRVNKLLGTRAEIERYFQAHMALPKALDALNEERRGSQGDWSDPETGGLFGYEITGEKSYRLCANFNRASNERENLYPNRPKHSAGRDCFEYRLIVR